MKACMSPLLKEILKDKEASKDLRRCLDGFSFVFEYKGKKYLVKKLTFN